MFPDGVKFYPDIKDGERGYNTDPARGADTFIPFLKGDFYKFCYSLSNSKSQLASANTRFTVDKNKKYKALIIAAPNGYDANTLTILKNNTQIYTRTSGTYERNFFEIREFDLKKGDVISISTSIAASNAIMFACVVWL